MSDASAPQVVTLPKGRCGQCERRRPVQTGQRFGGGTYRRPGRNYDTGICAECALDLVRSAALNGSASQARWSVRGLRYMLPRFVAAGLIEPSDEVTALSLVRQ